METLFEVYKTTVLKWIKKEGEFLKDPEISSVITEIEIDKIWHFLKKSQKINESSKPWILIQREQLPELQIVVVLKQSENFIKN
jgi:hypothetical protein